MKTTDFEYKTPPECITKGCHKPICWVTEDEEIGLCMKCYKDLEKVENKNNHDYCGEGLTPADDKN